MSTNGSVKKSANAGKPRVRTWSHQATSKQNRFAPKDDRTIKRNAPQCDLRRPGWYGAQPCVVRVLPNFNYENPEGPFDPTRLDVYEEGAWSDWWRSVPAAYQVGLSQQFTFLLYDPRSLVSGEYDTSGNPFVIFSRAIYKAKKLGEAKIGGRDVMTAKWGVYVDKRMVRTPQNLGFGQVLFYQNYNDVYIRDGLPMGARDRDLPQIIQVTQTANHALQKLIDERVDGYTGDPEDQDNAFVYGDVVNMERGKFVTFYEPAAHAEKITSISRSVKMTEEADETEAEDDFNQSGGRGNSNEQQFRGWGVSIFDTLYYEKSGRRKSKKADLVATGLDVAALRNIQWWDDLLHFPEHEEICMYMAHAYREEPNLLRFGWLDFPEFFTDEVEGVLGNRMRSLPTTQEEYLYGDKAAEDDRDKAFVPRVAKEQRSAALVQPSSYDDVDEDDVEDDDDIIDDPNDVFDSTPLEPEVASSAVKTVPKKKYKFK